MAPGCINILMHHGGSFSQQGELTYDGGCCYLQFTYVLAGWEGSAADARVLRDALARPNGLNVPRGEQYYTHIKA
jgi:hypothetical protein